jgi:hypothetical protein
LDLSDCFIDVFVIGPLACGLSLLSKLSILSMFSMLFPHMRDWYFGWLDGLPGFLIGFYFFQLKNQRQD